MLTDRRHFLKSLGCLAAAPAAAGSSSHSAHGAAPPDARGVLVDLTECIGCRRCEYACRKANGIEAGTPEQYDDTSVFTTERRPAPDDFTVVNAFQTRSATRPTDSAPVYAKINCMHCNYAACVSACIVGALEKQDNGAVTYDAWKCIGCRYCMVACPFQLPCYSYDDVLTPEVRKCQLCYESRTSMGKLPACVEECPRNVMKFGRRDELLAWAHARIEKHPERYVHHIYGEHEVGGTSWMYLSPVSFEQLNFLTLGPVAPPALTEAIQHGVFKYWIAPVTWYSVLCATYWYTGRRAHAHSHADATHEPVDAAAFEDAQAASAAALPHVDHAAAEAAPRGDCHSHDPHAPIPHKLLTPGVWLLIFLVALGGIFILYRFLFGLAATTNLDQQRPWGLWIAMDVGSGIALAGGGFIAAAIFHVFHRHRYHTLARSALVTALLGYTFYVPGLLADIGRWYNIWHPTLPTMWQGNSVLFEVGLCVMIYLNVQYAELTPIICTRLLGENWVQRRPLLHRLITMTQSIFNRMLPAVLCLGVCLSTFHQSSLGNLMVIAPYKLHEFWWSPLAPLLFLLSAAMVGLPMVIFTILFASWCLNREPEMEALTPLATRYLPVFIALYAIAKVGDMFWRGLLPDILGLSYHATLWNAEMLFGVFLPFALLMFSGIRRSPKWLAATCLLVILGVVLNRLNVFVLAYHPPYEQKPYFPSLTEFMVSLGLVAALLLCYRVMVTYLPILEPRPKVAASHA